MSPQKLYRTPKKEKKVQHSKQPKSTNTDRKKKNWQKYVDF